MTALLKSHFEKFLLGLAGGLALLSIAWSWWRSESGRLPAPVVVSSGEEYRPAVVPVARTTATWNPPISQSRGAGWVFELFAPPTIHCDPGTGKFAAGIPDAAGSDAQDTGIQVLAIRPAPFRVQLQGCFGPQGDQVAVLAAVDTREIWCARPGERWAALGVVLEKMDLELDRLNRAENGPATVSSAKVTLRDERTGGKVTLSAGVPLLTDENLAIVRLLRNPRPRSLREGDTWADGEVTYRVARVSLDPAVAEVVRIDSGDAVGDTLSLQPEASEASNAIVQVRPVASPFSPPSHNGP